MEESLAKNFPYFWWLIVQTISGFFGLLFIGPCIYFCFTPDFYLCNVKNISFTYFLECWQHIFSVSLFILFFIGLSVGLIGSSIAEGLWIVLRFFLYIMIRILINQELFKKLFQKQLEKFFLYNWISIKQAVPNLTPTIS
jgi:hypothetical protein